MSQVDLDTAHRLNPVEKSPGAATPTAATQRRATRARLGLIGTLPRITLYAGLIVAVALTALVLALLATGILGV